MKGREVLRQYIENRFPLCSVTTGELAAIRKGRAEFKRGEYVTLNQLHNELEIARNQVRKTRTRNSSSSRPASSWASF